MRPERLGELRHFARAEIQARLKRIGLDRGQRNLPEWQRDPAVRLCGRSSGLRFRIAPGLLPRLAVDLLGLRRGDRSLFRQNDVAIEETGEAGWIAVDAVR